MNRLFLLYSLCLLSFYSLFVHGFDLRVDNVKASLRDLPFKENINNAYDSAMAYKDYLRNKVEEVTINELEITGGKRLEILCSIDDYFYYLIHYLPTPLKTYILAHFDEQYPLHHRYSSFEERNEQFYLTIKALPPTIKKKAVVAKKELQNYLSTKPVTELKGIMDEYSSLWDSYINGDIKEQLVLTRKEVCDRLSTHRQSLQEYIDQGKIVKKLFGNPEQEQHHPQEMILQHWMGDMKRLVNLTIMQQKALKEWNHKVETGFLEAVTTLGPLRRLAEEMYDDAMNKTLESLVALEKKQVEGLAGWVNMSLASLNELDGYIASLPFSTTPDAVDKVKSKTDLIFTRCHNYLDDMKIVGDSMKALSTIQKVWSSAQKELDYSRWQWKYWVDLWNEQGVQAITHLFDDTIY
ncbi:hypothetical protein BC941DRAFT_465734 [Chlamydoabsidia padenii]|nr:hypothetical protein BC941DRAFT_465734 [Chlamydoabsidia padenii]